jgi:hypothetical protein
VEADDGLPKCMRGSRAGAIRGSMKNDGAKKGGRVYEGGKVNMDFQEVEVERIDFDNLETTISGPRS